MVVCLSVATDPGCHTDLALRPLGDSSTPIDHYESWKPLLKIEGNECNERAE